MTQDGLDWHKLKFKRENILVDKINLQIIQKDVTQIWTFSDSPPPSPSICHAPRLDVLASQKYYPSLCVERRNKQNRLM